MLMASSGELLDRVAMNVPEPSSLETITALRTSTSPSW